MTWVRTPYLIRKLFYKLKWKIKTNQKLVFLTFDDGPTPEVTDFVLNELDKFQARATFFCLGRNVEKYPDIYDKIITKGHKTGNHSYSHLNGWKTNFKTYIADIELAKNFIKSRLFRPPYGKIRQLQKLRLLKRYKVVMWDILSHDYDIKTPPEKCLNNVITKVKNGSIIVFHDSLKAKENLYYTLPKVLKILKDKGYQFQAIH